MNIVYGSEYELRERFKKESRSMGTEYVEIDLGYPITGAALKSFVRKLGLKPQQAPKCMSDQYQSTPDDSKEVVEQLRLRAEQGDADAAISLASHYSMGFGVPKNPTEAVKAYRLAAKLGHPLAYNNLGHMYFSGTLVKKDEKEAYKWWKLGAEQGDEQLQIRLAGMFYHGISVKQSYTEAAKWYIKAADQGSVFAANNLGFCYSMGHGVPQNYVEGYAWLKIAATHRIKEAASSLAEIIKVMSRAQIKEGKKLSRIYAKRIRRQTSQHDLAA